jgi:outer membrane protein OmpA-like peptidoglycan-associated protein
MRRRPRHPPSEGDRDAAHPDPGGADRDRPAGLAACASNTPPVSLTSARTTFEAVQADPAVTERAPLELQQARDALDQSDAAWRRGDDPEDVDHLAYVAERRAEIAQEAARQRGAEATTQNADAARAQALVQARTAEAEQARMQAAAAQQRAETLDQQLARLKANQANQGPIVLTLGDILFDVNGAQLKPGANSTISQLAQFLKQHPDRHVTIAGYTDATGGNSYNMQLSEARAQAVRTALIAQGVNPSSVEAHGFGESNPVASNDNASGRQLNRRVEVAVSGPNPAASSAGSAGTVQQ